MGSDPDKKETHELKEGKELKSEFHIKEASKVEYKGSPRRWWVLLVIALVQANSNVIYGTIYPIAIPVASAFNLSSAFYVNMTIMAQMFNPIPMTFLSIWMYSTFKTSNVLRGVAIVQLIGAALRALSFFTESYWSVAAGQYLCSCGSAFLLNVQIIIANRWFTDKERGIATALQIIAGPIGSGLSFGMTGAWFRGDTGDDPRRFLEEFISLTVLQFMITLVIVAIFFIVIRDKPASPPSAVAEVVPQTLNFKESLTVLRNNGNFCLLILTYSLPFGSFLAVGGLMSNVFDPFGFLPSEVSFISLSLLVAGVVGAIAVGAFLDKFEKYKFLMSLSLALVCVSTALVAGTLYLNAARLAIVACLVIGGFFGTGYFPLCFAYAAELTFPISPALINGMLTLSGSTMSVLIGLAGTFLARERDSDDLLDPEGDELATIKQHRAISIVAIMPLTALIAFFLNFCIKEDLKRLKYDKKDSEEAPLKVSNDDQESADIEKVELPKVTVETP